MKFYFILALYNLLLPVVFLFGFPAWLIKMLKRGGYGTGLMERFALFREQKDFEKAGATYIHAVSVGEVMIALKLIKQWQKQFPSRHFILAPTTATGHAVAKANAPSQVRVIYSPIDFILTVRTVLIRFEPRQIVLIEAETWPNLLHQAHKLGIPVSIVNARFSPRSRRRFLKLSSWVSPLFSLLRQVCIQDAPDHDTWCRLGLTPQQILHTGSIKFDPAGSGKPKQSEAFATMLEAFGEKRPIIMALSTHTGEEAWIGSVLREHFPEALYVAVPRHFERAEEVRQDLNELGYEVILRSQFKAPAQPQKACFVINSTGELQTWTAHAHVAIIGKSILGTGGQNPTEAIAANVPVICGAAMQNFQSLIDQLQRNDAVELIQTQSELARAIQCSLSEESKARTQRALATLQIHAGATERTVCALESLCEEPARTLSS